MKQLANIMIPFLTQVVNLVLPVLKNDKDVQMK
jgi:hypothetical protein